jgi:hemerythrin
MPLMVWNDKLSVNIKVIDDDHQKLLSMVNELYDAIAAMRSKQVLGRLLNELVAYTEYHFAREEEFFANTGYKDAAAHKKEHSNLTKKVLEIQKRYNNGTQPITLEIMVFLKDWLFDHILGSDAKFGPHLNARGIR